MIRVDVVVRRKNGKPIQTATVVRAFRDVRRRGIRNVGVTEARDAARAIVAAGTTSTQPGDFVTYVFRRNEVMQMRIRPLVEQRRNLLPARDRLSCLHRS